MANCILNTGLALADCLQNHGGTQEMYISTFTGSTVWGVNATGEITGATGANTFYKFQFPSETTEFNEVLTNNKDTQTPTFEATINSVVYKTDQTTRDTLNLLAMSRLFVITKDNDGQFVLLGKKSGMSLTTANINSGKMLNDSKGITYTMTSKDVAAGTVVTQGYITTLSL